MAAMVAYAPVPATAQEHQHAHPMLQHRDQVRAQLIAVQASLQRVDAALKRSQRLARDLVDQLPGATEPAVADAAATMRWVQAEIPAAAAQLKAIADRTRSIVRDESKPPERTRPGDTDAEHRASLAQLEERARSVRRLSAGIEPLAGKAKSLLARARALLADRSLPLAPNGWVTADQLQRQLGVIAAECDQAQRSIESLVKFLGLPGS